MIRKVRKRRHDHDEEEEDLPATVRFNVVVSVFLLAAFLARLLLSLTPAPLALPWKKGAFISNDRILGNILICHRIRDIKRIAWPDSPRVVILIPIKVSSHRKSYNWEASQVTGG